MIQNVLYHLMLVITSFAIVVIITPFTIKRALKNNIIDQPGLHKTHLLPKPMLGGFAIFIAMAVTILLFLGVSGMMHSLVAASLVLVVTGFIDDIYDLKPFPKLCGQFVAAAIMVLGNASLYIVLTSFFARFYVPELIVLGLIIGWTVMMINAFNLIDGLDGLATGTAAIIFLAMAIVSTITNGNVNVLGVQLIGFGACLGFLFYNFSPSKIFMGDAGSMLLGFVLATTYLLTIRHPFSAQLVLGSIFIFAYPAMDVTFAVYRRFISRLPVFKADQGHIHHVLLSLGFSVRKTVLLIYLVNIIFASLAVLLLILPVPSYVILGVGIVTVAGAVYIIKLLLKISRTNGVGIYNTGEG